ncbi:PTS sugar transporter subunit IIB [Granulicatella adiacens]|uniref:PTS sugar transporter subunit IIB n=1 Tax=Granulicatella adiacens TaxID=46124 RepID=UPI00241E7DF0|nr:PTS sugar transporter subunit IIB [Granulicatella adiacens]
MKTIMLVCNAGMSTSLLVNKMKAAASEIENETFDIFATPLSGVKNELEAKSVDIILVGPQVRFKLKELKEKYEPAIIVDTINVQDYGMMNGANVLKAALEKLQ